MRNSLILLAWPVFPFPLSAQDAAPAKQFVVHLRIFEGNPNGSVEEGTIRVVAAPSISTFANQTFTFKSGREITLMDHHTKTLKRRFYGHLVSGTITPMPDGKVTVDYTLETTLPGITRHRGRTVLDMLCTEVTQVTIQGRPNEVLTIQPPLGTLAWTDVKAVEAKLTPK
ncbi:MAG: hypothetical protein L0Y72_04705 [Gemmataceae bacterium]|nr:hypothetical protein [Gemmataceae bacterium]MCI0738321.1 hypothetical protein [Gemmataceae bacterium]